LTTYILRRVAAAIPSLLGVLIIVFLMVRLAPGDPALLLAGELADEALLERIRERFGLNEPWHVQFWVFLRNLVQGDLGISTRTNRPVVSELQSYFPSTVQLAAAAMVVASCIGIPTGVIAAVKPNSIFDYVATLIALLGVSMPVFWFGLLAILYFSVDLGWFPVAGKGTFAHVVLPAVTLGTSAAAILARMTRSSMLEVLSQDYVRTASAKGVRRSRVTLKHALRNALIPVVTVAGLQFGSLMAGTVLTETVFSWPGIGRLLVDSILARDYPVVQASVLLIATTFITVNLLVDLLYGVIDPRLRYA
jgi:peptide/nickel transport system permease protein/oligopeptide transport system permease protein